MPGAVIEPLYITDPEEGSIAASTAGQEVIAQGIASLVERFLARHRRHIARCPGAAEREEGGPCALDHSAGQVSRRTRVRARRGQLITARSAWSRRWSGTSPGSMTG